MKELNGILSKSTKILKAKKRMILLRIENLLPPVESGVSVQSVDHLEKLLVNPPEALENSKSAAKCGLN